jgi:hypothetical protein
VKHLGNYYLKGKRRLQTTGKTTLREVGCEDRRGVKLV